MEATSASCPGSGSISSRAQRGASSDGADRAARPWRHSPETPANPQQRLGINNNVPHSHMWQDEAHEDTMKCMKTRRNIGKKRSVCMGDQPQEARATAQA